MNLLRLSLFAVLLPLATFAYDLPAATATDEAVAAAIKATTDAALAKVTGVPTPTPLAPVVVAPAVAPTKDAPPAWTQTRDAFLSFALDKAKTYTGTVEQIASKAVDTAVKEGPATAIEFLHWRLAYHLLRGVTPICFLIVCAILFCKQWPKWVVDAYWNHFTSGSLTNLLSTAVGGIGTVVFGGITIANLDDIMSAIQILVAPRIYMIEQVLHLFGK